ncbi:sensor histidine kinase [Gordonia insulae]|uniref:Sensor-like histidine kinase SenX3 n=1 Tax=Gordonia insulae TaxID=2420509 RepID=A0A3G8JUZ0_9ACTN|nr:ATP-binding protein [Gordonia insulae]AZG47970.1 Signal-transduction histidine kinase senX3 [Gordonia insulae]
MSVALVLAAIAIALFCGVFLGLGWHGRGWSSLRLRRVAPASRAAQTPIGPADVTTEVVEARSIVANAPREVAAAAELRDSDVALTTDDGRMTKAGLLSLIVRHSENAVAVVDQFRDVVLYNHQAVELGVVRDRLLADAVWDAAKEVLDTEEQARFEFSPPQSSLGFVSTGRATAPHVESVRCLVRLVAHGSERYAVVYGMDDTEHSRVEATRRDFVANVSHELKTPVGAIGLLTEALLESADDEQSVEHFGRRVLTEADRMGNMVSELIALSRLQGGETSEFATVDVDELVSEAIATATTSAEAVGITLQADAPSGLTVRGDRRLLLTALSNLVVNAIAYSPPNTTVSVSRRITAFDGRPMVTIAVTDRGIGIAADDQERVFERFFRVDKARSRLTGGTGLGLAIVKHVAANHGGSIGLWSKPGTGSTFTLRIPQDLTAEIVGPVEDLPERPPQPKELHR